jgi:hypothetical protein
MAYLADVGFRPAGVRSPRQCARLMESTLSGRRPSIQVRGPWRIRFALV